MAKHVLAIPDRPWTEPILAAEPGEHQEYLARPEELWNQEQEAHARALGKRPEEGREQIRDLLPGFEIKRLVW